jgi:hypothetical protein
MAGIELCKFTHVLGLYIYNFTPSDIHCILPLLSARDLEIGPEGRYQSRADDKGNMKKTMY